MPRQPVITYKHNEAFCLMEYRDEVTGEIEIIWNSRDGVTPFVIKSRRGNNATHIDWHRDVRRPDFKPSPGMRMFVDASPDHEHIKKSAHEYVEQYWSKDIGDGMCMRNTLTSTSGEFMTQDEAVDFFIARWTKPGSPTIITVE